MRKFVTRVIITAAIYQFFLILLIKAVVNYYGYYKLSWYEMLCIVVIHLFFVSLVVLHIRILIWREKAVLKNYVHYLLIATSIIILWIISISATVLSDMSNHIELKTWYEYLCKGCKDIIISSPMLIYVFFISMNKKSDNEKNCVENLK